MSYMPGFLEDYFQILWVHPSSGLVLGVLLWAVGLFHLLQIQLHLGLVSWWWTLLGAGDFVGVLDLLGFP